MWNEKKQQTAFHSKITGIIGAECFFKLALRYELKFLLKAVCFFCHLLLKPSVVLVAEVCWISLSWAEVLLVSWPSGSLGSPHVTVGSPLVDLFLLWNTVDKSFICWQISEYLTQFMSPKKFILELNSQQKTVNLIVKEFYFYLDYLLLPAQCIVGLKRATQIWSLLYIYIYINLFWILQVAFWEIIAQAATIMVLNVASYSVLKDILIMLQFCHHVYNSCFKG